MSIHEEKSAAENRRKTRRFLCSELITVTWSSGRGTSSSEVAVLEDLSQTGACLFLPRRIEEGTRVNLRNGTQSVAAYVCRSECRGDGYFIAVEFDLPLPEEEFLLAGELLDLAELP